MASRIQCLSLLLIVATVTGAIKHLDSEFHRLRNPVKNEPNSDTVDYMFSRKQATWDNAMKGCKSFRNSRLLSVETSEESESVLGMINSDELFEPPLPNGTTFWTSGAYNSKLSSWEWTSLSNKNKAKFGNWTQKLWAPNQPTIPIQLGDRVVMERNHLNHSSWKTLSGSDKAFYICEF